MSSEFHDVIVIGAGPGGATVANLLAQQGLGVLMIDRGVQPTPQIPQTCFGLRSPLLSRLGIAEKFPTAIKEPQPVRFVVADDTCDIQMTVKLSQPTNDYRGMCLNRSEFDQMLVNSAIAHGVTYASASPVEALISTDKQITGVRCRTSETVQEYQGKAVIDASGKFSLIPAYLGLKEESNQLDERIAVFSHFAHPAFRELLPDGGMTVIAVDGGYILIAPLLGDRVSVVTVLAQAKATAYGSDRTQLFHSLIATWKPLAQAIAVSEQVLPVLPVINKTWTCRQFSGSGFLIVGEAGVFADPFFSNGVAVAMDSGEIAADTLAACLKQGEAWTHEGFAAYDEQLRTLFQQRQQEAKTWLDSLPLQQLRMSCADPHLPWGVPLAFLNLIAGIGSTNQTRLTTPTSAMTVARQTYATIS